MVMLLLLVRRNKPQKVNKLFVMSGKIRFLILVFLAQKVQRSVLRLGHRVSGYLTAYLASNCCSRLIASPALRWSGNVARQAKVS